MIDFDNRVHDVIDLDNCKNILNYLCSEQIELILTDSKEIQEFNRNFRNIDKSTDVLSFPLQKYPYSPLGSIVINIDKVKENADIYKHTKNDEFTLLFLHGLLHLLGYDHEIDDGQMRKEEEYIIKKFSLPKSLIIRNQ